MRVVPPGLSWLTCLSSDETFNTSGIYGFQCFDNGKAMKPTFLHVDDRYVASVHKNLRVGHPEYYYYYIQ